MVEGGFTHRSSIVVLVNGLPGAGKTTLARTLSWTLGLPLFSKDTIKEAHADVLGTEPPAGWTLRMWSVALGAAASQCMWAVLADTPGSVVLESCWPTDAHHFVVQGLQTAGRKLAIEIWCDVPIETARRRYEARHPRHPIHGTPMTDTDWARWQQKAQPTNIGPVLRTDTSGPVNTEAVVAWIDQQTSMHLG